MIDPTRWEDGLQGAFPGRDGVFFRVWAPLCREVSLKIVHPEEVVLAMRPAADGFFEADVAGLRPGARYFYILDGEKRRPDPASRFQPEGVHGPSEVTDPAGHGWTDAGWTNPPIEDYVIYELHTGAFTAEGTFGAAEKRIPYLKELGVTAVEIMPVAQFPGGRNWGYDGAYPYAPQNSYGGPAGLKSLVDALHGAGIAVILDVVYNHLGPEGSYLADYGPYFTGTYKTPWGAAINYDGPASDNVRRYFIGNALYWFRHFHMDALRLDAVHGIFDASPDHIISELKERTDALAGRTGKRLYLFMESDRNDTRFIRPRALGGFGVDAHWNDDFHHALHVVLTGERDGYYMDFSGEGDLLKSVAEGFVYTGQRSRYRGKRHGSPSADIPPGRFVAFSQNHDQVGNRPGGDRLSGSLPPEKLALAAAMVLLGPYIPLIFMGEEYGEQAPFMYFTSHSDEMLARAVREGRRREFQAFGWKGEIPDPQSEETFSRSRIRPEQRGEAWHAELFSFYGKLIRLRRKIAALRTGSRAGMTVCLQEDVLVMTRRLDEEDINAGFCLLLAGFNLSGRTAGIALPAGFHPPTLTEPSPRPSPGGRRSNPVKGGAEGGGDLPAGDNASGGWKVLLPLSRKGTVERGRLALGPYETALLIFAGTISMDEGGSDFGFDFDG
ncbi:MAG: malto-oligosyltrehalose trehalohydrolase [Nitrospiraceae bacterium]|nr:malto-oligosyltrehalose trehalohydrolase [Nitrospiraceae bacterium]